MRVENLTALRNSLVPQLPLHAPHQIKEALSVRFLVQGGAVAVDLDRPGLALADGIRGPVGGVGHSAIVMSVVARPWIGGKARGVVGGSGREERGLDFLL